MHGVRGCCPGPSLACPLWACLHDNKTKTKVAWLLPEETMIVWALISYFTQRWCKSVTFTIFPPNMSVNVYNFMVSGCTGKNEVLACFTLLVTQINASDPVLTLTVFSPKWVHPGSPAASALPFLRPLPARREILSDGSHIFYPQDEWHVTCAALATILHAFLGLSSPHCHHSSQKWTWHHSCAISF